jgi:hypothetical protein
MRVSSPSVAEPSPRIGRRRRADHNSKPESSSAHPSDPGKSSVNAHRAHDCVAERLSLCAVEVDVDPNAAGDAVRAAARPDVSLLKRGSESLAFVR